MFAEIVYDAAVDAMANVTVVEKRMQGRDHPVLLGVPETYWMRQSGDYRAAARGFESGTPDGLTAWIVNSCTALHAGAREALAIAQAASG